jgi:hypothetical protein
MQHTRLGNERDLFLSIPWRLLTLLLDLHLQKIFQQPQGTSLSSTSRSILHTPLLVVGDSRCAPEKFLRLENVLRLCFFFRIRGNIFPQVLLIRIGFIEGRC